MAEKTLLIAEWIAPMNAPPLRDGGIVFNGDRIAAVGPTASLQKLHSDAAVRDLGNAIVLPGLVNAHTHLELSSIQRGNSPARFVDWIMQLMQTPASPDSVQIGAAECLKFGVTTFGDITSNPAKTRDELEKLPLRGVSYGEVRAMAQRRSFLESRLEQSKTRATRGGSVSVGISPHAPYSIEIDGYRRCLSTARELGLSLCTHLAETCDEAAFLADHTGPFKELWDHLHAWDENVPRFTGGPIRFAKSIGLLDYPTLLAHVNYCDDAEMDLLAGGKASVAYCPRTHDFFGHPPHRWREMLARGINVAIGTDSCASSPDLNLVDDLRLLHRIAPGIEPLKLWQMATTRGAAALGMKNVGAFAPGYFADFVIFQTQTDDPLREIIEQPLLPPQVWIGGQVQQKHQAVDTK
jgi:cytosine/adenosine deaminase-related metal-dependent hydrolase